MSEVSVVLVHGAWHGAWCWERVAPLLGRSGVRTTSVQLPLTSFAADVSAARDALDRADGPVVLCGHSYGGAVITESGKHPAVKHLVYLCAVAPAAGEATLPNDEVKGRADVERPFIVAADGAATIDPRLAVGMFYGDCTADDAARAVARLRPISRACFAGTVTQPAWRDRPSTYVVAGRDNAMPPAAQRAYARNCGETVEWDTSHSPFLSQPALVADLLTDIVTRQLKNHDKAATRMEAK